jgi:translation initiation factor eIF-2B subunit delta
MIDETVKEISEMQTHSSSVVAVRAARALEDLLDREFVNVAEFERDLDRNSSVLRRANPSHASLLTTQRRIVNTVEDRDADTIEEAKAATADVIDDVVEKLKTSKTAAAKKAGRLIADDDVVLTHDYSTTVLEAIKHASEGGAELEVYVTEARPRLQGRRTARKVSDIDGMSATLIIDDALGHYLPECDRALIGMDCVVDDTLYNRVGTYPLAATAADAGVPVAATGSSTKLIEGGFRFENEFRPESEVILEPVEEFDVLNPSYDATPLRLIDRVLTDDDVIEGAG